MSGRWARPLFARPVGFRGYALGLMLGFLPCGLLYGALAAAAASGDPLTGAFAMIAFALGTVPALLAVGLAGHVAGQRWQGLVAGDNARADGVQCGGADLPGLARGRVSAT